VQTVSTNMGAMPYCTAPPANIYIIMPHKKDFGKSGYHCNRIIKLLHF